ncbi:MAG: nucleoside hydrolase [Candidatus Hodarchaeota archaeon]
MKHVWMIIVLLCAAACSPTETLLPMASTAEPTIPSSPCPTQDLNTSACPPVDVIPVIYDDDGSPDGTTALLYLISHPVVDLRAVNLSYGEVYPEIYIQHLARKMDDYGIIHFALGYGEKPESTDNIHFPESVREASSNFWGFPIPNAEKTYQSHPAPELIVSLLRQSPQPITIFVTGPCTNLAEALRIAPEIRENISAVYIMGGAIYVPGNVHDFYPEHGNVVAEWNFVADPQAAKEVFESGLDIYLVPLDATNQVFVSRQDTNEWRRGGEIADFAADIYDWLIDIFGHGDAAIWDLMTAAIMLEPDLCDFTSLNLTVITEPGDTLGQSAVLSEGEPNASVCLEPNAEMIRQALIDVFSNSR